MRSSGLRKLEMGSEESVSKSLSSDSGEEVKCEQRDLYKRELENREGEGEGEKKGETVKG